MLKRSRTSSRQPRAEVRPVPVYPDVPPDGLSLVRRTGRTPLVDADDVRQEAALERLQKPGGAGTLRQVQMKLLRRAFHWSMGGLVGADANVTRRTKVRPGLTPVKIPEPEDGDDPERAAERGEMLRIALSALTPRERKAVELRYVRGMLLREVGGELGVTGARALQILQGALVRMRKALERRGIDEC